MGAEKPAGPRGPRDRAQGKLAAVQEAMGHLELLLSARREEEAKAMEELAEAAREIAGLEARRHEEDCEALGQAAPIKLVGPEAPTEEEWQVIAALRARRQQEEQLVAAQRQAQLLAAQ